VLDKVDKVVKVDGQIKLTINHTTHTMNNNKNWPKGNLENGKFNRFSNLLKT